MKFRLINSIRIKLTLWYGLVVGLIFLVSGIFLYISMKKSLLNDVDIVLFDTVHEVEHSITNRPESDWSQIAQKAGEKFQLSPTFVQIMKVSSLTPFNCRLASRSRALIESNIILQIKKSEMKFIFKTKKNYLVKESAEISKYPLRILYYPVFRNNAPDLIILSAISLNRILNTLQRLMVALFILGPLLLFLISIGGFFIIRRAMQPVKAIVNTARKISAEDLSHRIHVKESSSEIGELIDTFNRMISRLEGSVNHIKRFTSNVSHELRTPLTIIRGEIEVTLRKARKTTEYKKVMLSVQEEAIRLEQIITSLLYISRMEAQSKNIPMQEISMDKLLHHVFAGWEHIAKKNGLQVKLKKLDPFILLGNETLLKSLIHNLLENAVKFTPESGYVEISLEKKKDSCILTVRDTGCGIPEESLPFIFERFYRVDKSRSRQGGGFGLGLATVKHVADIHGASVAVRNRINKGTVFTVCFVLHPIAKS